MKRLAHQLFALSRQLLRQERRLVIATLVVALAGIALTATVLIPAYLDPKNRMYGSSLGYARVMRALGKPFPVHTAEAAPATFASRDMGEGTVASESLYVPVVPMAEILEVLVEEGDPVEAGQVLARLDPSKAEIKVESARLAISTAQSESQRVEIGSAYVLAQERPEKDRITLEAAGSVAASAEERLATYEQLFEKGIIARTKLLAARDEATAAREQLELAQFNAAMSERGVPHSKRIARNAVADAEQALAHRLRELEDFTVRAPAAGVVERVLVRAGEYNQDSGKPGFILACGGWFEAHLDQSALRRVEVGDAAEVFLEAYPGHRFAARVEKVIPIVTYDRGGAEIGRPVAPRGTGAPEWPATFRVRLGIEAPGAMPPAPGMTGFARIVSERTSLGVPLGAVSSISAGKGVVHTVDAAGGRSIAIVTVGEVDDRRVEILAGIGPGQHVITEGATVLEPDDPIEVVAHTPAPAAASLPVGPRHDP